MQQLTSRADEAPFDAVLLYILTGVLALGALLATAFSADPAFRFHGYVMITAFVILAAQ